MMLAYQSAHKRRIAEVRANEEAYTGRMYVKSVSVISANTAMIDMSSVCRNKKCRWRACAPTLCGENVNNLTVHDCGDAARDWGTL